MIRVHKKLTENANSGIRKVKERLFTRRVRTMEEAAEAEATSLGAK